ncbi:hypothetical protein EG328_009139 [Venturia inaequalis]|uniref:dipeptidyl-peptidase IV n=1 Tax=Venturia inaequalis TaxID=5025 RepID=A0A8H3V7V5_VENIN|nr:hypothetical protein EG328_009139 [Venturia inaequalis]
MAFSVTRSLVFLGFATCISMPFLVSAQGTLADYEHAIKYGEGLKRCSEELLTPHWLPSNESFWYRKFNGYNASEFIFVDAAKRIRKPAFDHVGLARALSAKNIPANASSLPFEKIVPTADGSAVRFRAGDKVWQFDSNGTLTPFSGDLGGETLKKRRSINLDKFDNNEQSFDRVSGHAKLRRTPVANIRRADSPPIVSNSTTCNGYSMKDFSSKINRNIVQCYPSSIPGFAVVYDRTPEQLHPVYMVQSSPKNQTQPLLRTIKEFFEKEGYSDEYLKPGDRMNIDRPRMYHNLEEIATDDALFKNPFVIETGLWNPEGTEYQFLYNERGHKRMRVITLSVNGTVRVIHEENSKTFIDWSEKFYGQELLQPSSNGSWFNKGDLVWMSERSGWNHIYMINIRTATFRPITQGEWVVKKVEFIDEGNHQIWFTAFGLVPGQDYYHAHLARINYDGTGMKIFTADVDKTRFFDWSPSLNASNKYMIETSSRADMPFEMVLRSGQTGEVILELEKRNLECYKSLGWSAPERFVAKGRDGKTDIYGQIVKPSKFDPSKKYPVLEQIYAGPNDYSVPHAFETSPRMRLFAELGFIVVKIDGMGTNWRNKAFHDVIYKNLQDFGFLDRIAWLKKAAETRPWMDLEKMGVYGASAGGQSAMAALLHHPEFYKVGVADSGCHDQRMDKLWWGEQWLGWPVDQSYLDASNVVNAHKLEGKLLLLVPELDGNVDPASTMQVVNALNNAEKDYQLGFLPNSGHGDGTFSSWGLRKQRDFFVKELMGVEPPRWNQQKKKV